MNSVVTNIGPSQPLNSFLIQQTALNTHDTELLGFLGTSNINSESFSTIVELLNSRDIEINDLKLYDRNGTIFPNNSSNILDNNINTSSSTSSDSNLLLTASLFAANTADVSPNPEPTDVNTALENQIQNQTQVDTALGNKVQQQNQFNTALENQENTNNTLTQAENGAADNNNSDLLTQEETVADSTTQNTPVNTNNNPTAIPISTITDTITNTDTTEQTTSTSAQILLENAAQNAIRDNQEQNSMLINAQTSAIPASVLVGNSIRTISDTIDIAPTITRVAAISGSAPIEKIQANVDDNSHQSLQQQEIAYATSISHLSTSIATVRLLSAIL